MGASDSDGQPPSRKRSRTSTNAGEDAQEKKVRGRPRVDTQDATAADRRRTQIRLAQRAYRQRKETTISSLKGENAQLHSVIEKMNKSFLQLNDALLKSGLLTLNPSLSQQLKHTNDTFADLAKAAAESKSDGEEEAVEPTANLDTETQAAGPTETSNHLPRQQAPQPQLVDIGWGYTARHGESTPQKSSQSQTNDRPAPSFFYTPVSQGSNESGLVPHRAPVAVGRVMDQGISWDNSKTEARQDSQQLPFGLIDLLNPRSYSPMGSENRQVFSVNIPTPSITPPSTSLPSPPYLPSIFTKVPKPTYTYSHQETTFARRLTRASLEAGFQLLSSAQQRPAALDHVFKLSRPYMSLNELRDRFKLLLGRGVDEDLDCWETPFIHLGGAGTHYPRKDAQGNLVVAPNTWTVRSIGPISAKMFRAENLDNPSESHDLNIDLTGFEGEWFDAHDVQGYLEERKGCHIDPKDSFAEVLIDDDDADDESQTSAGRSYFFANNNLRINLPPLPRRPSESQSDTTSFGVASRTETWSSVTTPNPILSPRTGPEIIFGPPEAPFGLDMNIEGANDDFSASTFAKSPDGGLSTFYEDVTLGLDLAPGIDINVNRNPLTFPSINFKNEDMDMGPLGLDLMGAGALAVEPMKYVEVKPKKKKKQAWVDVSRLVEELIKKGVCLGRAPGFRRRDVDMAFESALLTAF